ncbi:hypothetical protein MBLNU230_g3587t1 [Neophaeotheca triangularis]
MLGTAKNPPFRMPTPRSSMSPSSPTAMSSPKRKRSDSDSGESLDEYGIGHVKRRALPSALRVETDGNEPYEHDKLAMDSALDSPRSKVAERLKSLDIDPVKPLRLDPKASPEPHRNRLKPLPLFDHSKNNTFEVQSPEPPAILETPRQQPPGPMSKNTEDLAVNEIAETPNAYPQREPSPPPPSADQTRRKIAFVHISSPPPESKPSKPSSPPPPAPLASPSHSTDDIHKRPISPLTLSNLFAETPAGSSPPSSLLTWQDSEITGYDIDATSPDDDGEGINGIGFRPTPAQAYQRSQQRKQQVSEWRAREAREARQRRIERRAGRGKREVGGSSFPAESADEEAPGEKRRIVRFAEVE